MPKQDWATDERKLQPVYEDISSGRHKPALSEVTRYLKKNPRSQPALILRAYLLHKLGNPITDVLAAWKIVEGTGEFTPRTLWWSTLLMKSIGRLDLLLALYLKLWTANPENVEIGQQVVLISISLWDTTTMCTSSRKMFNLLKTTVWARIAAWAEWIDKTSSQTLLHPDHVFLPPALENSLRIATTLLSTTKKVINSSEVLWLHVQILLGAGQEEAALEIVKLEGIGRGGIARSWWRIKTFQEVIRRMQARTSEEDKAKLEAVLKQEVDDFCWWMANMEDMQRNWANYDHLIQLLSVSYDSYKLERIERLFSIFEMKIGEKERAPKLAMIHLDRIVPVKMPDAEYVETVEKYWRKWGSKGVVVNDLQEACKGREGLLASPVQAWSEEPHTDLNSYLLGKYARLLLFRLKSKGFVPSTDEFAYTWSYYMAGRAYGVNLPDTDVRPADDIGLAAVQILILNWHSTRDEQYLFRAIVCLRQICEDSPVCMQARFLLIRLYRLIGAPSLVAQPLETLKIAEIQLDTLLHIYSDRASVDVGPGRTQAVFDSYREHAEYMYHKTAMDLPEQMKTALEHESYSQISSIRQLQQTIKTSLPAAMLAIESQRLALIKGGASASSEEVSTELAYARDADEGFDTRNWELAPLLVGEKPMREVLSLGQGDRNWVKSWREVYKLLREIMAEGPIASTFVDTPSNLTSAPEKAAIDDIGRVLRAAKSALQFGSNESANPLADADDLKGLGESVVQHALAVTSTRWDRLQSSSLLLELSQIVEAVFTRISAANKPKGKNKKAIKSPMISAFATSLEVVRTRLQEGKKEVANSLEGLNKADEDVNWVGMMRNCDIEDDLINTVRDEVIESRASAIANLIEMLS